MAKPSNQLLMEHLLEREGYIRVRQVKDGTLIGLLQMSFTMALVTNLDRNGYVHIYSYANNFDAVDDFEEWNGEGDPLGNWIKRRGMSGDFMNLNHNSDAAKR